MVTAAAEQRRGSAEGGGTEGLGAAESVPERPRSKPPQKQDGKQPKEWPRVPLGGPPLAPGEAVAAGVTAEVVMTEDGLEGSRFVADVLQLRGRGGKREALVQYHALFDDPEAQGQEEGAGAGGDGGDGGDGGENAESTVLLREWVSASSLAPPPPPPPSGWHKALKCGDACEALHEGGWWQVVVQSGAAGSAKEQSTFIIEASGYGVTRTVTASELRPSPAENAA